MAPARTTPETRPRLKRRAATAALPSNGSDSDPEPPNLVGSSSDEEPAKKALLTSEDSEEDADQRSKPSATPSWCQKGQRTNKKLAEQLRLLKGLAGKPAARLREAASEALARSPRRLACSASVLTWSMCS